MSKSLVRSIKNVANGYSSVQKLVRNATSNDPSGPTTYDMEELKSYTYQLQTDFLEIMDMLDRRLNDKGKNWRHIAKSLTVLDYLVRFGSEKCVLWAKDNIYIVRTLREFIHYDDANVDQGAIIRVKAKELVSLLNDDERLNAERDLAASSSKKERRSRANTKSDPYDSELQKALELSRQTAEEENRRAGEESDDADLQAALKLSLEEEEMRKQKQGNLLDLNDETPQQYYMTGVYDPNQLQQQQYLQQQQFLQQQQQQYLQQQYLQQQQQLANQQQYDMFGNPIQNPIATGLYQNAGPQPQQQPAFTGFHYGQPQQELQPLKTGSNNPFAIPSEPAQTLNAQSLNALAQQKPQEAPQFFTQPAQPTQAQPLKQQNTAGSKFNDSTHGELNNLLAQGTGIDTFGNTGHARVPHQHTQTQNFINSSGTGYKQTTNDVKVSSNATGNPFLNTGIGYQGQQQQQQQQPQPSINPAYTGYGFGNANPPQQQRNGNEPSLIDI